jgi:hypothetical protein
MTMIYSAHEQWSSRPADQRFWDLQSLHNAVTAHRESAAEASLDMVDMRVEAIDGRIEISGRAGTHAEVTHFAFGQLAARADAPAAYLRSLPATLAVQNINHGLKNKAEHGPAKLLLHKNGGYFARAITSDKYSRLWNYSISEKLLRLADAGWSPAPAYVPWGHDASEFDTRIATAEDAALSLTIKPGMTIAPAGLYASFEDMFVFLVQKDKVIDDGSKSGLMRGIIVWNSEVGKSTFGMQSFYFRGVCGNHIIWDAEDVKELRMRHVGLTDEKAFRGLEFELRKYADGSGSLMEAKIEKSRQFVLKSTKAEDVIDFVFDKGILSRADAKRAIAAVVEDVDGPAFTAWGLAQGITRISQSEKNADKRTELDRASGKVLQVAF